VLIAVQNDREWGRLCAEVLDRPELAQHPDFADNAARLRNRSAVDALVAASFRAIPRARLIARLDRAGIAFGSINTIAELSGHPALRRTKLAGVEGVALAASAVRRSAGEPALGPVPALGEHTEAVRAEFPS
jgi:crotonobetainyl-CoA:carnitine CoA-transferase CaiB-like acyl-CoA transferase